MCFIFLYLLIPRLNLPVHSPCENTHCFLCRVYTDKYEANVEGYNAPISCVLSLCQVLTWVLMNSLNSYTTQEKSVALLKLSRCPHGTLETTLSTSTVYIHCLHPCLHPLGSKLLTHCSDCQNSRCFHTLTQNWFTSEFLQHGKK